LLCTFPDGTGACAGPVPTKQFLAQLKLLPQSQVSRWGCGERKHTHTHIQQQQQREREKKALFEEHEEEINKTKKKMKKEKKTKQEEELDHKIKRDYSHPPSFAEMK
jgi:2-phospho-L-lactate transferase/gluconeogenesis factor (CofD/UPF0052 family)